MRVLGVDDRGIRLSEGDEVVVDVLLQGNRVWSFYARRDTKEDLEGGRLAPWPAALRPLLDGEAQVRLVEHLSGVSLHEGRHRFGSGPDPVDVTDDEGRPLALDKSGRLVPTFADHGRDEVTPLLDALSEVIGHLTDVGVEAFPAYGTLLGAVRDGRLIRHDSDADLGYVSRLEYPVDVIRESFAIQRHLVRCGYRTRRYSGLAFKVDVVEPDGLTRGLDVFGGFFSQGRLYLMGALGVDFRPEWIFPLGSTVLEGRAFPAPREPARLLEATYGAGWEVPDPAFRYQPSPAGPRLTGWFRGVRSRRLEWDHHYGAMPDPLPSSEPSPLARFAAEREGVEGKVIELGAGLAGDALWFARRGASVTAYDFADGAMVEAARIAQDEGLDLVTRRLNLLELRSVLGEGARLAHDRGPRVLLADDLPGSTTPTGRRHLWRLASMALRDGGTMYVEATLPGGGQPSRAPLVTSVRRSVMDRELMAAGLGTIEHEVRTEPDEQGRRVGRWVLTWPG